MTEKTHLRVADLLGFSRLVIDATLGITGVVEHMHHNISRTPAMLGTPSHEPTGGITGLVYRSIYGITRLVGATLDTVLAPLAPLVDKRTSSAEREAAIAALNGVLGDYLVATDNPLAITMQLRQNGHPLVLNKAALAERIPQPSGKILLMAHGLCLNDLQWRWKEHDYGELLANDLGYTPVYLHYNTGLHMSLNGRALADQLEALVAHWPVPVEELVIVAHSMGGLISRSAHHYGTLAGHHWMAQLRKLIFLASPHHGAPLERGGNWLTMLLGISPYTHALGRLGKIRSAGITDLRHSILLDEDWEDRDRFAYHHDPRQPLPLPAGVQCYTIVATTGKRVGDLNDKLLGDGIVPLQSALGLHIDPRMTLPFPAAHQWIGYEMNHMDLLHRIEVYTQVREWLAT